MASATTDRPSVPEGYELKKKKPIYKRIWFWLLAIVAVAIVATVSGGGDDKPTVSGSGSSGGDSAAPAAGPTFQGQTEDDTTAEPGQTITIDDVAITASPLFDGDNTFGATLCSTITIVNDSSNSESFNLFDYNLQDPNGATRQIGMGGSGTELNSGELAAGGGTVTGDVCFDNATAMTGTFALTYAPAFSLSNERAVWVSTR